jgi:arsenate reductase (thioredoxin)
MEQDRLVVFVCEHGSAKSVVAAAHFNRLARERGAGFRAISRGTSPDAEIAPGAARGLEGDGLGVGADAPERLSATDLELADRVVAFCRLEEPYARARDADVWDDVPPVSEDYARARDRIVERLSALLDELDAPARVAGSSPL